MPRLAKWSIGLATFGLFAATCGTAASQNPSDALETKRIAGVAGAAMIGSRAYGFLTDLSDGIGARMTGTEQGEAGIQWGLATMNNVGLSNVHLETFTVWRGWSRGIAEVTLLSPAKTRFVADSMGWVGSTPPGGVDAAVVQVDLSRIDDELKRNSHGWSGKVLEVTRHGEVPDRATALEQLNKLLNGAQETHAVAVITGQGGSQSQGTMLTHTGILGMAKSYEIPVINLAHENQEQLDRLFASGKTPRLHVNIQNSFTHGPVQSSNVIGEIPGVEFPKQVIVVSGHLDSWDLAQGATDNGCGVAVALEAADAIIRSGYRPRRTIRFVLFTGEEQGMLGSRAYLEKHLSELPDHLGDINLDLGQAPVTGFNLNGRNDLTKDFRNLTQLLAAFGSLKVDSWPFFGSDNGPFTLVGLPGIMMEQDTTEYSITHHSGADTLDKVDSSVLARNAAIEAILAFWIADRTERFASPLSAEQTRAMLVEAGQEKYLKLSGMWRFDQ